MVLRVIDRDFVSQIDNQIGACAGNDTCHIEYTVALPLLLDRVGDRMLCHEVSAETDAISTHLSERVHALYNQLSSHRAVLVRHDKPISVTISVGLQRFNEKPHCPHRRFHSRRLNLFNADELPNLDFVHRLVVQTECWQRSNREYEDVRPVSLLLPLHCLSHLPAAHTLELPWMWERPLVSALPDKDWQDDATQPWEGPLRDARHDFGAALLPGPHEIRIPETLRRAVLYFWWAGQYLRDDQSLPRANLVSRAAEDPVSLGLCRLAAQLEVFDLCALITPALFPTKDDAQWIRMRRLRVEFHLASPDGSWYFDGPADGRHNQRIHAFNRRDDENQTFLIGPEHYPRETAAPDIESKIHDVLEGRVTRMYSNDSVEQHLFRIVPRREKIEPLLMAFAKAITKDNMPLLEDAELFAWLWWRPRVDEDLEDDESLEADWETWRWGVKYIPSIEQQERQTGQIGEEGLCSGR